MQREVEWWPIERKEGERKNALQTASERCYSRQHGRENRGRRSIAGARPMCNSNHRASKDILREAESKQRGRNPTERKKKKKKTPIGTMIVPAAQLLAEGSASWGRRRKKRVRTNRTGEKNARQDNRARGERPEQREREEERQADKQEKKQRKQRKIRRLQQKGRAHSAHFLYEYTFPYSSTDDSAMYQWLFEFFPVCSSLNIWYDFLGLGITHVFVAPLRSKEASCL